MLTAIRLIADGQMWMATRRSFSAASLGRHDVDEHAGAAFETCRADELRPEVHVPVVFAGVLMRCRMEHEVVGHVAEGFAKVEQRVANGATDGGQRCVAGVLQMQVVLARDDQQFVGAAAPVGAQAHDVVVGEHDALAIGELGFDGGAQDARTLEAGKGALFFQNFARHERQAEQLTVRVGQRGTGLATVVDDGLGVADVRRLGVVDETTLQRLHRLRRLVIVAEVDATVVIGRVHEDLVDAAGLGHHVHRAEVMNGKRIVAVEGGKEIGNNAKAPRATLVHLLECRQRGFFVTGAERARTARVGLDLRGARGKVGWALSTVGHDGDPTSGERIQTHLRHLVKKDTTSDGARGGSEPHSSVCHEASWPIQVTMGSGAAQILWYTLT